MSADQIEKAGELKCNGQTMQEIKRAACGMALDENKRKRIVIKIGGKSLSSPELINNAASLIAKECGKKEIILVVSAPGNMTSSLIEMLKGVTTKVDPKKWDCVLSHGERISAAILSASIESKGIKTVCLDPLSPLWPIITDEKFGDANPIENEVRRICKEKLEPLLANDYVVVMPGFIGKTAKNEISTMGRGGSDLTAFLMARCTDTDEVIKISDVDGVYLNNKKLDRISIDELSEICSNGASGYEKPDSIIQLKALAYFGPPMIVKVMSHREKDLGAEGTVIYAEEKT